ncbi:hypothetical protein [Halopseudomonas pelagia]|uniref:hypothetical protein n=1 Tax=Halopseudomonas pelagia TaxID=553151 RepID=UPI0003B38E1A|nr:hypothetical protein [Halopseudomonas pelagia]|tara:strand:+ start:2790 stop:3113 length:324 start_codon:yes stop_codon:yes gene_type:complete
MNKLKIILLLSLMSCALVAQAAGSFRLMSGKLISSGQSKSEIIAVVGVPLYQDVETIGVDEGGGGHPIKREVLTYKLDGSIGGEYLVIITVENNTVVSITSKQTSRM